MASFGKRAQPPVNKSPNKITKTGTSTAGAAELIKTIRERETETKTKELARWKEENQILQERLAAQEDELESLRTQNALLGTELEDVKKEYVDLERSFAESIDLLQQLKVKVDNEQEEKLKIQTQLMNRVRELEALLAAAETAASLPKQALPPPESSPSVSLAPEHVHQYHLHLRDTLRVVADKLVEGLLRLDSDIDATAPLVNAYRQAQKDQSPLMRTIRDSSNDFVFGKPSATYAVAGTQIMEVDESAEAGQGEHVGRTLWNDSEE